MIRNTPPFRGVAREHENCFGEEISSRKRGERKSIGRNHTTNQDESQGNQTCGGQEGHPNFDTSGEPAANRPTSLSRGWNDRWEGDWRTSLTYGDRRFAARSASYWFKTFFGTLDRKNVRGDVRLGGGEDGLLGTISLSQQGGESSLTKTGGERRGKVRGGRLGTEGARSPGPAKVSTRLSAPPTPTPVMSGDRQHKSPQRFSGSGGTVTWGNLPLVTGSGEGECHTC